MITKNNCGDDNSVKNLEMNDIQKMSEVNHTLLGISSNSLFRPQVLNKVGGRKMGSISLSQPIPMKLLVFISLLLSCCILFFLTFGNFTRKTKVTGITVPQEGNISIVSPNAAIIKKIFVKEGTEVINGQKLFELSSERETGDGRITELVGHEIISRRQSLNEERILRKRSQSESEFLIEKRISNNKIQIVQIENEIALLTKRRSIAQDGAQRMALLQKSGFISMTQGQQKEDDLIAVESQLAALNRVRSQLLSNDLSLLSEKSRTLIEYNASIAQLERTDSGLKQEIEENSGRKTTILTSPTRSVVGAVSLSIGQAVSSGSLLANLIPYDQGKKNSSTTLNVELFLPSRKIGFVKVGQSVLLRYDAFPYQKFGHQLGTIIAVSGSPISIADLHSQIANTVVSGLQREGNGSAPENVYRITVRPASQFINLYGQNRKIQSGLSVEAYIEQEKRKIWEWIFEPIIAISKY